MKINLSEIKYSLLMTRLAAIQIVKLEFYGEGLTRGRIELSRSTQIEAIDCMLNPPREERSCEIGQFA